MAGSYKHVVNRKGEFTGIGLIDNLGDAYEALEEMYGMIWYLARGDSDMVSRANQKYVEGIALGMSSYDRNMDRINRAAGWD